MAVSLVGPALSPARVHERARAMTGHQPCWTRLQYLSGLYSKEHYRTCSWCGCIHPVDLVELLQMGSSSLKRDRTAKLILVTPNPIAGVLVRFGSMPGAVFAKDYQPADLMSQLLLAARQGIKPTIGERLAQHYERPCMQPAPELIAQPFYAEHATQSQWAAIEAVAEGA